MKNRIIKLTSFLLILVITASVLYSCKGGNDEESTTGEQASEVVATTAGDTTEPDSSTVPQSEIDKIVLAALGDDADWDGDYSSLTKSQKSDIIEEMYKRGYVARFNDDELVVVTKEEYETAQKSSTSSGSTGSLEETATTTTNVTTTKAVPTTAKGVTTTARKGIVPGTTAKNGITTTTKKSSVTTTKAGDSTTSSGSNSTTTTTSSSGGNGGGGNVGEGQITKPDVTYLEKYVINVIKSGKYTVKMLMKEGSDTVNLTRYVDGNNSSSEFVVTSSGLKFTAKYIIKNNKHYVIVPLFAKYAEISENDIDNFLDYNVDDLLILNSMFGEMDSWDYLGITRITGMNIESYKDSSGRTWKFYFNSGGLQKVESVSDGYTETYNIVIESGVTSSEAFVIPSGYKKVSLEDLISSADSYSG